MNFDYSESAQLKMSMIPYRNDMQTEFPDEINKQIATSVAEYSSDVRSQTEAKKLPDEQAIIFHHNIATDIY